MPEVDSAGISFSQNTAHTKGIEGMQVMNGNVYVSIFALIA